MCKLLSSQLRFLKKVCEVEPKDRAEFLSKLKKHQVRTLCEISLNLKNNKLKLSKRLVKALTKYKNLIIFLAERGCWKNKKRAIRLAGSFIFKLICPAFLQILSTAFTEDE